MLNNKNERLNSLFKLDVKSGILFFNSKVHKVFLKIGRMTVSHLTNTYAVIPAKAGILFEYDEIPICMGMTRNTLYIFLTVKYTKFLRKVHQVFLLIVIPAKAGILFEYDEIPIYMGMTRNTLYIF